ncbi:hypothetical protein Gpo141_00004363 [Globisporangium polare]
MSPGLVALDVVLRERETTAALPGVVRLIRRFAQVSLQLQVERALEDDDVEQMERVLAQHSEDVRLDLLESDADISELKAQVAQYGRITNNTVQYVLYFGAQHGRKEIVEWAVGVNYMDVTRGLVLAVSNGHLPIVKRLYSLNNSASDRLLTKTAAKHGRTAILQWLYANRRDPMAPYCCTVSEEAARFGHVDVLEWLYAVKRGGWSSQILKLAVEQGHLRVAQWLLDHEVPVNVLLSLQAALQLGSIDMLEWLHDHYADLCPYWMLEEAAYGRHVHAVQWLMKRYADKYEARGAELAAICGDLERVGYFFSLHKKQLKRRVVRSAMCKAAKCGHLPLLQWLVSYEQSQRFQLPKKALWKAAAGGHLEVLRWCVERMGDQYVLLDELDEYVAKQYVIARGHSDVETVESLPYKELLEWLSKAQPSQR